jgi:hypothetical protein
MKRHSAPLPVQASSEDVDADIFLTEAQAADLININPRTLQQWRLRGAGPKFVRISSRCVRYRYCDVTDWAVGLLRSSTSEY